MKTNADELEKRLKKFGERVRDGWKAGNRATEKQVSFFKNEISKQWESEQAEKKGHDASGQKDSTSNQNSNAQSSKNSHGHGHSH